MMNKKSQEINPAKNPTKNTENPPSENIKRSARKRLGRVLMITEFGRNAEVTKTKDELYDSFDAASWSFDSKYANHLFRLYADKDKDITITKAHFFAKYTINIPDVPKEEAIRLTHYIKTLRFIRNWLKPVTHQIKSFASDAKTHAAKKISTENADEVYSTYDRENEKLAEHNTAKGHLRKLMEEKGYDRDRFNQEKDIISGYFQKNNYQDLMVFALFGFYYFDRKQDVYEAFTSEQRKNIIISFDMPGFRRTSVPLWTFLKIIEHLDFKKHLFSV